jgi:hypothetical protein
MSPFSDYHLIDCAMALSRCRLMNVVWAGTNASSSNWTDFPCQCIKLVGKRSLVTALQQ